MPHEFKKNVTWNTGNTKCNYKYHRRKMHMVLRTFKKKKKPSLAGAPGEADKEGL